LHLATVPQELRHRIQNIISAQSTASASAVASLSMSARQAVDLLIDRLDEDEGIDFFQLLERHQAAPRSLQNDMPIEMDKINADEIVANFRHIGDKFLIMKLIGAFDCEHDQVFDDDRINNIASMIKELASAHTLTVIKEQLYELVRELDKNEWNELPLEMNISNTYRALSAVVCSSSYNESLQDLFLEVESMFSEIESKEPMLVQDQITPNQDWSERKASWERFKNRVKDFPKAVYFDNNNEENRKKQYYSLASRYMRVILTLIDKKDTNLEYAIDSIDRLKDGSFLGTCRTGWSERISSLESLSDERNIDLLRAWDIATNLRKDLVKHHALHLDPDHRWGTDVHIIEGFNNAMNDVFSLGYAERNQPLRNWMPNHYRDLYLFLSKRMLPDFLQLLEAEYSQMTKENRQAIFSEILQEYYESAKNDESLLITPFDALRNVHEDLDRWWDRRKDYSSEALHELVSIKSALKDHMSTVNLNCKL